MSDHTPGPWGYAPCMLGHEDNRLNPVVNSPGRNIARVFSETATLGGMTSSAPPPDEATANARLIAAAPELLRVCQLVLVSLRSPVDATLADIHSLEAAIAKAEGTA